LFPPELVKMAFEMGIDLPEPQAQRICRKLAKRHRHRDKKKLSRRRMVNSSRIKNRR